MQWRAGEVGGKCLGGVLAHTELRVGERSKEQWLQMLRDKARQRIQLLCPKTQTNVNTNVAGIGRVCGIGVVHLAEL